MEPVADAKKTPIEVSSETGEEPEPEEVEVGEEEVEEVFESSEDQKTTFVPKSEDQKVSKADRVQVQVKAPQQPVQVSAGANEAIGEVVDKDVTHKLRIPIKIIKTEDVAHVNLNLKLEIECTLQTETVKKQESKAEKLASKALEDFLLGKSKKRK